MQTLRNVVYASTAVVAVTDHFLEALLLEARKLNSESGVTGVLLCCDGNFMQCFEGEASAVEITWARIKKSRRHTNIYELMNDEVRICSFPDWQMGFQRATSSELLLLSTARWQRMASLHSSGESVGFGLMQQFWRNARPHVS